MPITPLPAAPAITDTTAEFNSKAFAWVDALDTFTTEANQLAADVSQDAADVAAAALDAAAIEAIYADMGPLFLGGKTNDPTLDNDGNPLIAGATYYNIGRSVLRVYDGANWADAAAAMPVTLVSDVLSGDGVETEFTLSASVTDAKAVSIFISGVHQVPGVDYTVVGTALSFTTAPPLGTDNIFALTTTPVAVLSSAIGVATISALRDTVGAYDGQVAIVSGYYAAGDGGGGPSRYWSSSSTATDDGGAVIKPVSVSGAGRWLWEDRPVVDAKWYGVAPATDSAALLNAAIAYLSGRGGGILDLPEHTFGNEPLLEVPVVLFNNVWLRGRGMNTSGLKLKDGAECNMIESRYFADLEADNVSHYLPWHMRISDLYLDGNKANQWGGSTPTGMDSNGQIVGATQTGHAIAMHASKFDIMNVNIWKPAANGLYCNGIRVYHASADGDGSNGENMWYFSDIRSSSVEAMIDNMTVSYAGGAGVVDLGANDKRFDRIITRVNKGCGAILKSASEVGWWHSYSNDGPWQMIIAGDGATDNGSIRAEYLEIRDGKEGGLHVYRAAGTNIGKLYCANHNRNNANPLVAPVSDKPSLQVENASDNIVEIKNAQIVHNNGGTAVKIRGGGVRLEGSVRGYKIGGVSHAYFTCGRGIVFEAVGGFSGSYENSVDLKIEGFGRKDVSGTPYYGTAVVVAEPANSSIKAHISDCHTGIEKTGSSLTAGMTYDLFFNPTNMAEYKTATSLFRNASTGAGTDRLLIDSMGTVGGTTDGLGYTRPTALVTNRVNAISSVLDTENAGTKTATMSFTRALFDTPALSKTVWSQSVTSGTPANSFVATGTLQSVSTTQAVVSLNVITPSGVTGSSVRLSVVSDLN